MSQKIARRIRKALRSTNTHPRDVRLRPMRPVYLEGGGIFEGQRRIDPNCGRGIYRAAKKAIANGTARLAA